MTNKVNVWKRSGHKNKIQIDIRILKETEPKIYKWLFSAGFGNYSMAIKRLLIARLFNTEFVMPVKTDRQKRFELVEEGNLIKVSFKIDREKDAALMAWYESLPRRKISESIRQVLNDYLSENEVKAGLSSGSGESFPHKNGTENTQIQEPSHTEISDLATVAKQPPHIESEDFIQVENVIPVENATQFVGELSGDENNNATEKNKEPAVEPLGMTTEKPAFVTIVNCRGEWQDIEVPVQKWESYMADCKLFVDAVRFADENKTPLILPNLPESILNYLFAKYKIDTNWRYIYTDEWKINNQNFQARSAFILTSNPPKVTLINQD
jgi:hypothetical protein